jgi:hypothetical protein
VGSPEGRTPNVDAKFLTTFFLQIFSYFQPKQQSLLPSFVYIFSSSLPSSRPLTQTQTQLNSSPLQPPGDQQYGVSGHAPKKFFGQISPGAQRFARGRMPE